MELSIKTTRAADFCGDQIDVITHFADITNAVIKKVYSTLQWFTIGLFSKCSKDVKMY